MRPTVLSHSSRILLELVAVTIVIGAAAMGAGCAKARAATQPEMPLLDAPPPPPRVIAPIEGDVSLAAPATTPDESAPPARSPQKPASKPESRPAPAARAEREQDREGARSEEQRPSRTLQTPDSGSERAIRDQLARASAELQRVDYRTLSPSLKEQYDVAKRFIQQSEEALRARNLVYAATLADKAAEIAEVLPRR